MGRTRTTEHPHHPRLPVPRRPIIGLPPGHLKDACGAAHAVASLRAALLDRVCARRAFLFVAGTEKRTRGRTEKLTS